MQPLKVLILGDFFGGISSHCSDVVVPFPRHHLRLFCRMWSLCKGILTFGVKFFVSLYLLFANIEHIRSDALKTVSDLSTILHI